MTDKLDTEVLRSKIELWVARPEFHAEMIETQKRIELATEKFRDATRVNQDDLRRPCTI